MIKLKIGSNYLLTKPQSSLASYKIVMSYMMGCFNEQGAIAISIDNMASISDISEYVDFLTRENVKEVYLLHYFDVLDVKKGSVERVREIIYNHKMFVRQSVLNIQQDNPDIKVKVISINNYMKTPEYILAARVWDKLIMDKESILSVFGILDRYKTVSMRVKQIPQEIKIFSNDIERLGKKKDICDRTSTLESLQYLQLIEDAAQDPTGLILTIKELQINPSEPLGKIFSEEEMKNNPYLYKACQYIYQGCHFKMPKTKINISTSFRPTFLETVDHSFDKMFRASNWSSIGYPHFGKGHFCGGEFNDTIAHAKEYGLEYYFLSLKQYLTTANMRDSAGYRVWWYPVYNDANELVYCAGVDIMIEEILRAQEPDRYKEVKDKSWEEKLKVCNELNLWNNTPMRLHPSHLSYYYHGEDSFLKLLKERDIELYNEIKERSAQ